MLVVILFHFWISRMLCALLSRHDPDFWRLKFLVSEKELHILRRTLNQHGHAPLDHFIILGERQLKNLLREYLGYYNHRRPHQGLGNQIPSARPPNPTGPIRSRPVLFGLYRDYYRSA